MTDEMEEYKGADGSNRLMGHGETYKWHGLSFIDVCRFTFLERSVSNPMPCGRTNSIQLR
jgi:hypothetical protein